MPRILLSTCALLAACSPSSEKVTMSNTSAIPEKTASDKLRDSPAEAVGRRTLSTAFVRIGPDGNLTVELKDGRTVVLRDVVMNPKDYCGVQVGGPAARSKYCGGYADVAAARPGEGPLSG